MTPRMTGNLNTLFDSEILERARAETVFGELLYDLLLTYQECRPFRKLADTSLPVGQLDAELSELYNQIWHAAFNAAPNAKKKKESACDGDQLKAPAMPLRIASAYRASTLT